jgi:hypothetical protein
LTDQTVAKRLCETVFATFRLRGDYSREAVFFLITGVLSCAWTLLVIFVAAIVVKDIRSDFKYYVVVSNR